MRTKIIALKLFFFICFFLQSQNSGINGVVFDDNDNVLVGVNIVYKKKSGNFEKKGTTSDFNGNYSINLEPGKYTIEFQYIGYETYTLDFDVKSDNFISKNIFLQSTTTELDLVVISAGKFEQKLEEVTVSMDVIKPSLIENKNTTDLEILMNQSPGVQVVDGQANIRGGSGWSYNTGSRVLVMIDDMPILSGDRGTVQWNMIPMEIGIGMMKLDGGMVTHSKIHMMDIGL